MFNLSIACYTVWLSSIQTVHGRTFLSSGVGSDSASLVTVINIHINCTVGKGI